MGQRTYSDVMPDGTIWAWEVERLWKLTKHFDVKRVPISSISDFDIVCWFDGKKHVPTCRTVAEHARKIIDAEFDFPVILSAKGHVMDGMHRIAKAWILGYECVDAVQFEQDPEPDERLCSGPALQLVMNEHQEEL